LQFKRNTMWTTFIILGLLLLVLAFLIIRAKRQMSELKNIKDSEKVKILTDQNFSNKTKSGLVHAVQTNGAGIE
jgi:LPXTG-motif cell wall-anchored protein